MEPKVYRKSFEVYWVYDGCVPYKFRKRWSIVLVGWEIEPSNRSIFLTNTGA